MQWRGLFTTLSAPDRAGWRRPLQQSPLGLKYQSHWSEGGSLDWKSTRNRQPSKVSHSSLLKGLLVLEAALRAPWSCKSWPEQGWLSLICLLWSKAAAGKSHHHGRVEDFSGAIFFTKSSRWRVDWIERGRRDVAVLDNRTPIPMTFAWPAASAVMMAALEILKRIFTRNPRAEFGRNSFMTRTNHATSALVEAEYNRFSRWDLVWDGWMACGRVQNASVVILLEGK